MAAASLSIGRCSMATILTLAFCSNSFGADPTALLEQIYNMGDYGAAAKLAGEQTAENPKNVLAHFYLANCLVKLGRHAEAKTEYQRCMVLGRGTHVETSAKQALYSLALESKNSGKPSAPSQTPTDLLDNRINKQIDARRKNLLERAAQEKKVAMDRFDLEVKRIQSENKTEADEVLKARTQAAFEKYSAEANAIEERYRKQADQLLKASQDLSARSKDENASSKLVPTGSNIYLQNYENLQDDTAAAGLPSENPLHAVPAKLSNSNAKQGAGHATKANQKVSR